MPHLELRFESRLELVSLAGAAVRAMCEVRGVDPESASAIELLAVEIATNVVEHGYQGRSGEPVQLRITFGDEQVDVEVADTGEVLPAERVANAELPEILLHATEDLPEGGFGLALVRMLADTVEVTSKEGWNVLRFTRRLKRRDAPEEQA